MSENINSGIALARAERLSREQSSVASEHNPRAYMPHGEDIKEATESNEIASETEDECNAEAEEYSQQESVPGESKDI